MMYKVKKEAEVEVLDCAVVHLEQALVINLLVEQSVPHIAVKVHLIFMFMLLPMRIIVHVIDVIFILVITPTARIF